MPDAVGDFEVDSELREGARVVSVRGELDLATHERLSDQLREAAKGTEPIVVDLSGCEFMDSSGVRALLIGLRDAGTSNGFAVAGPTPQVQRILDVTGLKQALAVHESVDDAIAALGK